MNKGDCFILDVGTDIYVYTGQNSKRTERLKAISAANQIRDQDHSGRARVHIIDSFSDAGEIAQFFEKLGSGSASEVAEEQVGGDDLEFERSQEAVVTLYKVSDDSGEMSMTKVGVKPLHQNQLNSSDCFILDTVTSGIFVWIGKQCNKDEKVEAMRRAQRFLTSNNYPAWTTIQRIVEDGEPSAFKQYFSGWRAAADQIGLGRVYTREQIAAAMPEEDFDPSSLHTSRLRLLAKNSGHAFGFMPDNGTGSVEIWRVENFELVPVDPENYGFFFGGDSYVVKYTYEKNNRQNIIIYYWQGRESTQDERAAAAIHAVRLDNEVNGKAVQVRVTQGNEPRHFLRIFKGKMIVFLGGKASGFRNLKDHDTYDVDGTRLFHIQGTSADDVRAVQVPEVAGSLNSDDVFVLETPNATYLWLGNGAIDEEKEFGANAVSLVSPDTEATNVTEGEEPEAFWSALGGQGSYKTAQDNGSPLLGPRLFHCWVSAAGKLRVEEVNDYKQEDLNEDDIMVLDSGDEIYVWVGKLSTPEERQLGFKMAEEYLKSDPTERSHELNLIFTVKQADEPESFKSLFPSWDPAHWEDQVRISATWALSSQLTACCVIFDLLSHPSVLTTLFTERSRYNKSQPSYEELKRQIVEANAAIED
uniref:Gelsolin-like domain-containing protein n=1 Tax=Timema douglasi TaxID=61478 RepID=A0A7R8Z914_TIMDO|nr:unnamed protein product [Timema douglasi]